VDKGWIKGAKGRGAQGAIEETNLTLPTVKTGHEIDWKSNGCLMILGRATPT
jgi:hypothetical protein